MKKVLGDVVRRINSDDGAFEGGEGKRGMTAGEPVIQGPDCQGEVAVSCVLWQLELPGRIGGRPSLLGIFFLSFRTDTDS